MQLAASKQANKQLAFRVIYESILGMLELNQSFTNDWVLNCFSKPVFGVKISRWQNNGNI